MTTDSNGCGTWPHCLVAIASASKADVPSDVCLELKLVVGTAGAVEATGGYLPLKERSASEGDRPQPLHSSPGVPSLRSAGLLRCASSLRSMT